MALGKEAAGLFFNDETLADKLMEAGTEVLECLWKLPCGKPYQENMKGTVSDLKNTGGPEGGACNAAAFIRNFIEDDVKWAHLDIAG